MDDNLMEMELNNIIETSNNNITITDENGIILRTNPEHWTMYGLDEGTKIIGRSVYELEKEGILKPSINILVLKERKRVQILQHTQTGKVIMSTGYPIFTKDGKLVRVVSYSQDQTEIWNLQEQYKQLQSKVEGFQTEVEVLREREAEQHPILFRSISMQQIMKTITRVAKTDATILFLGPSGVGKSTLARTIHDQSNRNNEPFIEVNCSTIPESLFESEMFGYDPGAFTGAQKNGKQGLIEQADNGTLFLDEIGELPLAMQVKLLKVLQEKKLTRVGGKQERHVNFRLITATNQDLNKMVQEGQFRLDLFYRLNVIPIQIPALTERKEDIPILLQHYLGVLNQKYDMMKRMHPSTYEALTQYEWSGNVREMENLLERLLLTIEDTVILPEHLPIAIRTKEDDVLPAEIHLAAEDFDGNQSLKETLESVERQLISKAYHACKTTYEMAHYLGISQPTVVYKLKKYKDQLDFKTK